MKKIEKLLFYFGLIFFTAVCAGENQMGYNQSEALTTSSLQSSIDAILGISPRRREIIREEKALQNAQKKLDEWYKKCLSFVALSDNNNPDDNLQYLSNCQQAAIEASGIHEIQERLKVLEIKEARTVRSNGR